MTTWDCHGHYVPSQWRRRFWNKNWPNGQERSVAENGQGKERNDRIKEKTKERFRTKPGMTRKR